MQSFSALYPLTSGLGLKPVQAGSAQHLGCDEDDVKAKLGAERFAGLMSQVKAVFCCDHRKYPGDHTDLRKRGCEAHCIYAEDIETFLKGGG